MRNRPTHRRLGIALAVLVFAGAASCTSGDDLAVTRLLDAVPALHPSVDGYPHGEVVLRAPDGATHELPVLVASTPEQRQHGLMEVTALPDGTGMAFLFSEDRTGGFWMAGTLIGLDIVYLDATGAPVTILTMVPCDEQPCPVHSPSGPYRTTLEVPAGYFDRIGFGPQWRVHVTAS